MALKEGLVKSADDEGSMASLMLRLYSDSIRAYTDPGSFHSQMFFLSLADIDHKTLC